MKYALLAGALFIAACAGAPLQRPGDAALAMARRAEAAGRHFEAARAYDQASTEVASDKDRSVYALAAARETERSGDRESAQRRYEAMAHLNLPDAPAALMRLAQLRERAGDEPGFRAFLKEILHTQPHSGISTRALLLLVGDAKDPSLCSFRLEEMHAQVQAAAAPELVELERYLLAQCADAQGRGKEALAMYMQIATDYPPPSGHYNTESLMRAAELQQSYADYRGAIETLRRLLAQREHAQTIGSYEKPSYAIAQSRIATLLDTQLHDTRGAISAWATLYNDYPYSRARDEGAFEAALLERRGGDTQAACAWLTHLKKDQPTSRYVRCIPLWCQATATTTCSDYLNVRWQTAAPEKQQ